MRRRLTVVMLALGTLGATLPMSGYDETTQWLHASKTERVNFAPGGTVRFENSFGNLYVEGWDRPEVEIEVNKEIDHVYSPKKKARAEQRLAGLQVTAQRHSDTELTIVTSLPDRGGHFSPPLPRKTKGGVLLDYMVRVPRDSKLVIHHKGGYVLVTNTTGEIEATSSDGDIDLMLPGEGKYKIDAKCRLGHVSSDFDGRTHSRDLLGQSFLEAKETPGAKRIYLRMGVGGISIQPLPPER